MASYLYQAPAGVVGDITRPDESNTEPAMLVAVAGVFAQAFGIPMRYVAGGISQFIAASVAADFAGILVREAPSISGNANSGLSDTTPWEKVPRGLMVRGYCNVLCTVGTPARGGIVYFCNNVAGGAIGDFQATTSANNLPLSTTQATWASDGKDANNIAEIRIAR